MERCKRCKKPLKNQKSVERGYGLICYRKIKREQAWKEFEKIQFTIYDFLEGGISDANYIGESK